VNEFKLTGRQQQAQLVCSGPATHIMLEGGSRSGKTFLHTRNVIYRALKAKQSRHCVLRFRLSHIRESIMMDTLPKVMSTAFAGVNYNLNKSDMFATFPGGSEVWLAGMDDKERTEKILGKEFCTIYLNECSQIPLTGRNMVITRLAQKAEQTIGNRPVTPLRLRMYYDCNPPSKSHWTYKLFHRHIDPDTGLPLRKPEDYAHFKMSPQDNAENLSADYIESLRDLPARMRLRFLEGEYADATPNALFTEENIEAYRIIDGDAPQLIRVVVAVDPSGSGDEDNAGNDEIGIVVVGLGVDGVAYVLEDCSIKAGPATWGNIATTAYDRHRADMIVGEVNYGGDMVRHTIQTARARTPYQAVHASRGKAVRADPVSALYEKGKVRHVGNFEKLEAELTAFSTFGYTGEGSPNRADALVWAVTALFPQIITRNEDAAKVEIVPPVSHWNRNHRRVA
jgi:phage terminase large subunit-like protein